MAPELSGPRHGPTLVRALHNHPLRGLLRHIFQNRWESFTDPNRWLIRFQTTYSAITPLYSKIMTSSPRMGAINEEIHELYPLLLAHHRLHAAPHHWTSYPERLRIRCPGTRGILYETRIDHWPAPGYIVKDDRSSSPAPDMAT